MTIPSTGAVSFSAIQTEFGGSNPIGLNEYYAGGAYVPAGTTGTNGAVPSSGAICVNKFHGTTAVVAGSQSYTTAGTYTWVVPTGVTSVSAVAIAGGGGGAKRSQAGAVFGGNSGAGGSLSYRNNYSVTPGDSYAITVGAGRAGTTSNNSLPGNVSSIFRCGVYLVRANFTTTCNVGTAWYAGGPSNGACCCAPTASGGGGAGGYSGSGGFGGSNSGTGQPGTGGAGGGGASGANAGCSSGGGGGGVGINGQGSSGAKGSYPNSGGGGGSGGATGTAGTSSAGGAGGAYGAGGGESKVGGSAGGNGGGGAIRIIWPGNTRTYPSTCTGSP